MTRSVHTRWGSLAVLLCGCAATPAAADADRGRGTCPDEPPALEPAPGLVERPSEIHLTVRLARARLRAAIERRVPEVLARGGRKLSVGRLSYSVQRGPIGLELGGSDLVVNVPIQVQAGVCVPIGPACPSVGGCSPKLTTTVRVPLWLDDRYSLGGSRVGTEIHRGCAIAGYDATGQIRSNANRQSQTLKREIDRSVPSIRPEVAELWARLHDAVPRSTDRCLVAAPRRVLQQPPAQVDDDLSFRLVVAATLGDEPACPKSKSSAAPAPLPPPAKEMEQTEGGALIVYQRKSWEQVSRELTESLSRPAAKAAAPAPLVAVQARGVRAADGATGPKRPRIALAVSLEDTECGSAWLLADVRHDANQGRLRLHDVTPIEDRARPAPSPVTRSLARWLEQYASMAAAAAIDDVPEALRAIVEQAANKRTRRVAVGPYRTDAAALDLYIAAEGLVQARTLRGTIPLTVK